METVENLNNNIKDRKNQIKNLDTLIKNYQKSINTIQDQIDYRQEVLDLNSAIPLEMDPDKKKVLQDRQVKMVGKIIEPAKDIPTLRREKQNIQDLMDPEILARQDLKQELEQFKGAKSAHNVPMTRKNFKRVATIGGVAALAALGTGLFMSKGDDDNSKRDKMDTQKKYIIPAPEVKDKINDLPADTVAFPGFKQQDSTLVYHFKDVDDDNNDSNEKWSVDNADVKKKQNKVENNIEKKVGPGMPEIDNYEYYNAKQTYDQEKIKEGSSLAYRNWLSGNFKYHVLSTGFSGMNSSFWRERVAQGLDKKMPLKPGERLENLKEDQLMITDFSIKDGVKYDRAIIVGKGTQVVVDSSGHIVALAGCMNRAHVSKVLCLPKSG